jgi:hypothetical protein
MRMAELLKSLRYLARGHLVNVTRGADGAKPTGRRADTEPRSPRS